MCRHSIEKVHHHPSRYPGTPLSHPPHSYIVFCYLTLRESSFFKIPPPPIAYVHDFYNAPLQQSIRAGTILLLGFLPIHTSLLLFLRLLMFPFFKISPPIAIFVHDFRPWSALFFTFLSTQISPKGGGVSQYVRTKLELQNRTADVGVCSFWLNGILADQVQWTFPYSQQCVTFLVPKPLIVADRFFVLKPFTTTVWVVISSGIVITSLVINLTNRNLYPSIMNSLLDIYRMYVLNPKPKFPKPIYSFLRLILTISCINALIVSTSYNAGVTSILTKPTFSKPINSLSEMADRGLQWGAPDLTTKQMFEHSFNKQTQRIARNYVIEENSTIRDKRLNTDNYATIVKKLLGNYVTDTDTLNDHAKNSYKILHDCSSVQYVVLMMQENSAFKFIFDKGIQRLVETGLIDSWYRHIKYMDKQVYMNKFFNLFREESETGFVNFTLDKVYGAFYFLIAGHCAALICFLIEIYRSSF